MRVFVTGATGWVGSAVVDELLGHGYEVTGLARSDRSADALRAKGAQVVRGSLDDAESLARGAREADAVVHLANKHSWDDVAEMNRAERAAVQTLGDALVGTDKPFVVASGLLGIRSDGPARESDRNPAEGPDSARGGSENLALDFVDQGVRTVILRLSPTVHGDGDQGFLRLIADAARRTGVSGYIEEGQNVWPAVHVTDTARLVRLALEKAKAGTVLHAAAQEGIPTRDIAEAIGSFLGVKPQSVPQEKAMEHFGFIGMVFGLDAPATSETTRTGMGWEPQERALLADIAGGAYA